MAENERSAVPPVSPEQRRVAVGQYERAQQVVNAGDFDYGIHLMMACCKLDPANLIYRRFLRQIEKSKFKNNLRGSRLALLATSTARARIKAAKRARDYLRVLEHGEEVLRHNPWDTGAQMDMAEAADAVGLLDVAVWVLEQARQKDPKDVKVNRALARLYEKRGNFALAIALWEIIRGVDPTDVEARHKSKDLAATDTIHRGQYEQMATGEATTPRSLPSPPGGEGRVRGSGGEAPRLAADPTTERLAKEAQTLRARIEADAANVSAYLNLAGLHRRAGQLDEARAVLEEGCGPTANHFDLTIALADLDIEPFRRDLILTEARLREQPTDELRQIRAQLRKEIDTRELDVFRQKADRYPSEKGFRFEVGIRLLRLAQVDEAIRELQPLRNDTRYQWKVLVYLAYCFLNKNNWRLAMRNFEEALQLVPPNEEETRKDILYQLAIGSAATGDLTRAVDLGHDLANIDFGYRDINRLLEEWQAKLQET